MAGILTSLDSKQQAIDESGRMHRVIKIFAYGSKTCVFVQLLLVLCDFKSSCIKGNDHSPERQLVKSSKCFLKRKSDNHFHQIYVKLKAIERPQY